MVVIGRSAKLYQERRQPEQRTTQRGPGPRIYLEGNTANSFKLHAPLPLPDLLYAQNGNPPPDAGLTDVWPHGQESII